IPRSCSGLSLPPAISPPCGGPTAVGSCGGPYGVAEASNRTCWERLGWLMGFEPTTTGITIPGSTSLATPTVVLPRGEGQPRHAHRIGRARQDSNLLPPA